MQPVVCLSPQGEREIESMRWRFKLSDRLLFNARSEGVATANFWKDSFVHHRCIIPADSFYEWQKVKTGEREPTFSILTQEANTVMRPIHDRQPVILEPRDYTEWLAESIRPPVHLLRLVSDDDLEFHRVDADMNHSSARQTLF